MEKLEFASPGWLRRAGQLLAAAVHEAGETIKGQSFSLCEIYTDAPRHLLAPGADELAWTITVAADGSGHVACAASPDARCRMRMRYEHALAGARTVLSDAPADILTRAGIRAAAAASGLIELEGDFDATAMPMRIMITRFHNKLAEVTR